MKEANSWIPQADEYHGKTVRRARDEAAFSGLVTAFTLLRAFTDQTESDWVWDGAIVKWASCAFMTALTLWLIKRAYDLKRNHNG